MGGEYAVFPFTLLLPGVPAPLTFLAGLFVSGGMLYNTQYQWLSFGPGMVCMTRARLFMIAFLNEKLREVSSLSFYAIGSVDNADYSKY